MEASNSSTEEKIISGKLFFEIEMYRSLQYESNRFRLHYCPETK